MNNMPTWYRTSFMAVKNALRTYVKVYTHYNRRYARNTDRNYKIAGDDISCLCAIAGVMPSKTLQFINKTFLQVFQNNAFGEVRNMKDGSSNVAIWKTLRRLKAYMWMRRTRTIDIF